jgi:hypothetical protein
VVREHRAPVWIVIELRKINENLKNSIGRNSYVPTACKCAISTLMSACSPMAFTVVFLGEMNQAAAAATSEAVEYTHTRLRSRVVVQAGPFWVSLK